MKKIAFLILAAVFLSGCGEKKIVLDNNTIILDSDGFDLKEDPTTKILYIENTTYCGWNVYTPYYSENGKLCKYYDGKIVEVGE